MIGHDSRYESARIRFAIARLPAFFASEPARLPASPHGIARGSPVVIVPAVRELLSGAETAGSGLQKTLCEADPPLSSGAELAQEIAPSKASLRISYDGRNIVTDFFS